MLICTYAYILMHQCSALKLSTGYPQGTGEEGRAGAYTVTYNVTYKVNLLSHYQS